MIAAFLLWLSLIVVPRPIATSPAPAAGQLAPATVLRRYAAALEKIKEPRVISFDYTLEQTGPRTLAQTHRVFRSGDDERDETLTVDGKRLSPPKVRIFRGRRNRYTLASLAPRQADYDFVFSGTRPDGHHLDYVFRLTPKGVGPFTVTDVTIDGVRFLPLTIGFITSANLGEGAIDFGSNARWWVPYTATARATVVTDFATEKLTFYTYRFPQTLPDSTFTQARRPAASLAPVPADLRSRARARLVEGAAKPAAAGAPRRPSRFAAPRLGAGLDAPPENAASTAERKRAAAKAAKAARQRAASKAQ